MSIELLLVEVSSILNKYDIIQQKTGGYFNIFEIASVSTDEVVICRVIYELINPKGKHYQGTNYLQLFVKHVLDLNISMEELKSAVVYREYFVDNKRRIDLVIETKNYFIPIEVKIYAYDQEAQCTDYLKNARNSSVYYLTLHGNQPTEISVKGLNKNANDQYIGVKTISFEVHILNWLYMCLELKETIVIAPIREILLQLISVFRKLTGQIEEGKEMEIKNLIAQSSEKMKCAFAIESSIKECKLDILNKLFSRLDEEMKKLGKTKVQIYDYEGDAVTRFYDRGKTWPGLSYVYKSNVRPDTDILLRIEIEERLYAGFCVAHKGTNHGQMLSFDEIEQHIPHLPASIENGWWTYWEYIPTNSKGSSINFKYPENDENYIKLFDDQFFETYIANCMERINALLSF